MGRVLPSPSTHREVSTSSQLFSLYSTSNLSLYLNLHSLLLPRLCTVLRSIHRSARIDFINLSMLYAFTLPYISSSSCLSSSSLPFSHSLHYRLYTNLPGATDHAVCHPLAAQNALQHALLTPSTADTEDDMAVDTGSTVAVLEGSGMVLFMEVRIHLNTVDLPFFSFLLSLVYYILFSSQSYTNYFSSSSSYSSSPHMSSPILTLFFSSFIPLISSHLTTPLL
jgi:hypothetical protein